MSYRCKYFSIEELVSHSMHKEVHEEALNRNVVGLYKIGLQDGNQDKINRLTQRIDRQ
jgi:hypothetical protein